MEIFSIYDRKSMGYFGLYLSANLATMMRDLTRLPKEHQYVEHAADYELVAVGKWSQSDGTIDAAVKPEVKCSLAAIFPKEVK